MAYEVNKTIVLVGMMGAGKTAVGHALAEALSVPFLDSDLELKRAANMEISEIFARDGEAFFRKRETEIIARLLETHHGVLSTGGGAFLQKTNRNEISRKGISVWLQVDLDVLWQRVRNRDTRPLLRTPDPKATLTEIYKERVPIYARADVTVSASPECDVAQMAGRVLTALLGRPGILKEID